MKCVKDDEDPTSRCGPCRKINHHCGERTLPPAGMEWIRASIRNHRLNDIVEWMMEMSTEDRILLLKQFSTDEADLLSAALNSHRQLYSNGSTEDMPRCFLIFLLGFTNLQGHCSRRRQEKWNSFCRDRTASNSVASV